MREVQKNNMQAIVIAWGIFKINNIWETGPVTFCKCVNMALKRAPDNEQIQYNMYLCYDKPIVSEF
jgi:hypothetical protein